MRKIIVFIFAIVFGEQVQAQSPQSPFQHHLKLNASGLIYQQSYKIFSTLEWEIRRSSHAVAFGPAVLISSHFDASDKSYPKLTGFRSAYRYYPFPAAGRLDCFLQANLYLLRIVDRWQANDWNPVNTRYESFDYINTEYIIDPHVGYGLTLDLFKGFFIEQYIEVGYFFSWIHGDETENPGDIEIMEDLDYRSYGDRGLSLGVNFAIGYTIK